MPKLSVFIRFCVAILLVLCIIYVGNRVNFIFTPLFSLVNIVLIPLMLSSFFYYLLRPIINLLEKRKLNRTLAVLFVFIIILVLLVGFILLVWPPLQVQLVTLVNNAPYLFAAVNTELIKLGENPVFSSIFPEGNPLLPITDYLNTGFALVINYLSGVFTFVSNFALTLIIFPIMLFFMLREGGKFGEVIVSLFPEKYKKEASSVTEDIDSALSNFIVGRVLVNLALGVLMYIGFLIIGLPYALLLTVIAVIMNFVPFIGAIVSTIPIFIIGLLVSPSTAIWSIVVVLAAQQIQDNVIAPYIFGKKLELHPLTTIILILIGGDLWGIIGVLLIIPVYMAVKIVVIKLYRIYVETRAANRAQSLASEQTDEGNLP